MALSGAAKGMALVLGCYAACLASTWSPASAQRELPAYPAFASDAAPYLASIKAEQARSRNQIQPSGLTVPHHLLASDLIARGFWAASSGHYDRIVILFPDHFKQARLPFSTTLRDFDTVLGRLETDRVAVARLLNRSDLFDESTPLFQKDHGLHALLPYVAHFFPAAPIVPIAVSIRPKRADWDRALSILKSVITARTLIIQSTDFSHYLPLEKAIQRDQEVLNILSATDASAIAELKQPDHLDSAGAQYLQLRLQHDVFAARPLVIANANSQSYLKQPEPRTTSYIVQVYHASAAINAAARTWNNGKTYYFAGDTLLGRHFRGTCQTRLWRRRCNVMSLS